MREVPRKKQKPLVDLLVYGHAPQSKSENHFKVQGEDELKNNPLPMIIFEKIEDM
jgi:hypothetical protein